MNTEGLAQPFWQTEALDSGLSAHVLAVAVRSGTLERLTKGLYAVQPGWAALAHHQRHAALTDAVIRRALIDETQVLSHISAALRHGSPYPWGPLGPVVATTRDDRTSRDPSILRLHRGKMPRDHVQLRDGVPLTTPARTVIDCFRVIRLHDAVAIADDALRRKLLSLEELHHMRAFQTRWPGVAAAKQGLRLTDPRREGWFESVSIVRLHEKGVPLPTPQVRVLDQSGDFIGRVDALWLREGVVGEADGRGKLLGTLEDEGDTSAAAVAGRVIAQGVRESRLRDTGLGVFRWDPGDLLRSVEQIAQRWADECRRSSPRSITARFECDCCAQPLTYCPTRRRLGF